MNIEFTFIVISAIITLGVIQASIENILLFSYLPALSNYPLNEGILKSRLAKKFSFLYNYPGIWVLSILRLISGLWLLGSILFFKISALAIVTVLVIDLLGLVRWKYLPNSDLPMRRFILTGVLTYVLFDVVFISNFILIAITYLLCVTYLATAYNKLKDKNWKNGKTIIFFLNSQKQSNLSLKWLGYGVILFQLGFFIGLMKVELAILFMAIGFIFHFYLYVKHEINFFFWTFLAAYPAYYYIAQYTSDMIDKNLTNFL